MILRHGSPREIVTDQGREFCNQIMNALEELTGFRHLVTSAYHPQSNGLDERLNQTLKAALQKLVK
jgi:transposase InsO family protein